MSNRLTKEEARLTSEDFLWNSKVGMRHSFFMIEEYIQNDDKALTNVKCTNIVLNKDGYNFFIAHIEEK